MRIFVVRGSDPPHTLKKKKEEEKEKVQEILVEYA